jgi:hypothetical protein
MFRRVNTVANVCLQQVDVVAAPTLAMCRNRGKVGEVGKEKSHLGPTAVDFPLTPSRSLFTLTLSLFRSLSPATYSPSFLMQGS